MKFYNYESLFKVIGKFARLYDVMTATAAMESTVMTGAINQTNGTSGFSGFSGSAFLSRLHNMLSINSHAHIAIQMASTCLTSSTVLNMFLSPLPSGTNAAKVVAMLASEMANDKMTLSAKSSTGIVNFLGKINQFVSLPQSDLATYPDSTYVVDDVI